MVSAQYEFVGAPHCWMFVGKELLLPFFFLWCGVGEMLLLLLWSDSDIQVLRQSSKKGYRRYDGFPKQMCYSSSGLVVVKAMFFMNKDVAIKNEIRMCSMYWHQCTCLFYRVFKIRKHIKVEIDLSRVCIYKLDLFPSNLVGLNGTQLKYIKSIHEIVTSVTPWNVSVKTINFIEDTFN